MVISLQQDDINEHKAKSLLVCLYKLLVSQRHLLVKLALVITLISGYSYLQDTTEQLNQSETQQYITQPKVGDLYFLDFRVLSDTLRPKQKYRLAKVVDITGNITTLVYGNYFYLRQQAIEDSIRYGQLRYQDYFATKRYNLSPKELNNLLASKAIYMIKRPKSGQLFGNFTAPVKYKKIEPSFFIPGRQEYNAGRAFLSVINFENNEELAFKQFKRSAELGYPQGKIKLAEMYLDSQYIKQDLNKALYWFKQAALQSHKPGVLKYTIVCERIKQCSVIDFYQELIDSGVNLKVRDVEFKLSP